MRFQLLFTTDGIDAKNALCLDTFGTFPNFQDHRKLFRLNSTTEMRMDTLVCRSLIGQTVFAFESFISPMRVSSLSGITILARAKRWTRRAKLSPRSLCGSLTIYSRTSLDS